MKNENDYRYNPGMKVMVCCQEKKGSVAPERQAQVQVLDSLGILASAVCMIHCLAVPVLFTMLPSFAVHHHAHGEQDLTHILLAGWVVLFCLFAIVPGYLKHGHRKVLISMMLGLTAVLIATFHGQIGLAEAVEIPLITLGNLVVISTHIWNRKLLKRIA